MKVLGIDPGTISMGYAVIAGDDDRPAVLSAGALTQSARSPLGKRLNYFFLELLNIIDDAKPDVVAVERPFVARNPRSALAIGQAQAIALLAAANRDIPAREYTPTQVKQTVTGYGGSDKAQVQEMVRLQLGLDYTPEPNDVADAMAVAICHLRQTHLENLLAGGERNKR